MVERADHSTIGKFNAERSASPSELVSDCDNSTPTPNCIGKTSARFFDSRRTDVSGGIEIIEFRTFVAPEPSSLFLKIDDRFITGVILGSCLQNHKMSDHESIDSQLEWELEEGIPQIEDPFIQKYMAGRDALIQQEKKQRHDHFFKQTSTPFVKQAAKIMAAIRRRELREKWTGEYEEELASATKCDLHPGMMFTLARNRMGQTELWKIIERMPKGALLHAHLDAMYDIDWLVDQAIAEPGMCIMAPEGLSSKDKRDNSDIRFQYCGNVTTGDAVSLWKDTYIPNTPIAVTDARRTFPDDDTTFKKWIIKRCTLSQEESLWTHHGLDAIWKKFTSTFPIVNSIAMYEPILRNAFARLLGQLAADGITYCDFRMVFPYLMLAEGKTTPETDSTLFFKVFGEELANFKKTDQGKNFHGARMIWTTIRAFDNQTIATSMKECIVMKKRFPELICGFDCVGQEDSGRTLQDLTPMLFWFKKKCHEAGVDVPFFFHAGECLGDGDSTDNNLFDAILLGTRRIGHAYSLYKHPLLIDMVKEKKILVECCPISNEILRLASSIKCHSLPALLSRGVAVSLNNDDPAILGIGKNGLSHDYWQAFMGFDNLGLDGLAVMAENSLKWCAVEDQRQPDWIKGITEGYTSKSLKAKMLQQWRTEFHKWCQWIVMEYVLELDDDDSEEEDADEDEDDEDEDEDSE